MCKNKKLGLLFKKITAASLNPNYKTYKFIILTFVCRSEELKGIQMLKFSILTSKYKTLHFSQDIVREFTTLELVAVREYGRSRYIMSI